MTVHLELMSKPRLVAMVREAHAETARQAAVAEYWRKYADRVALTASNDRILIRGLRALLAASNSRYTLRRAS